MVVLNIDVKIDIQRLVTEPPKGDPEIATHADRPALRLALQTVNPQACDIQIFRQSRRFQSLEYADALSKVRRPDSPTCASGKNHFEALVAEGPNRAAKLQKLRQYVNQTVASCANRFVVPKSGCGKFLPNCRQTLQ